MSSFPDVLSATLEVNSSITTTTKTFTVPAEYAFAVVQVCLIPVNGPINDSVIISTSHGIFGYINTNYNAGLGFDNTFKNLPILNLIIKGGESFSLLGIRTGNANSHLDAISAKVTALCHKKPS